MSVPDFVCSNHGWKAKFDDGGNVDLVDFPAWAVWFEKDPNSDQKVMVPKIEPIVPSDDDNNFDFGSELEGYLGFEEPSPVDSDDLSDVVGSAAEAVLDAFDDVEDACRYVKGPDADGNDNVDVLLEHLGSKSAVCDFLRGSDGGDELGDDDDDDDDGDDDDDEDNPIDRAGSDGGSAPDVIDTEGETVAEEPTSRASGD